METADDPWFGVGFDLLAAEFMARGELERREVLAQRLAWNPRVSVRNCALLYRMMLLLHGETCVAVRDHSAIMPRDASEVVVHLSHSLVVPAWRRKGLAALLRALPVQTARECRQAAGRNDANITLVAEMEPWRPGDPANITRLTSYEKAGFRLVGPRLGYRQPDFRSFAEIDAGGGPRLIPLELLVRRIGREEAREIPAAEVHRLVRAILVMYAVTFRARDLEACLAWADSLVVGRSHFPLVSPTLGI